MALSGTVKLSYIRNGVPVPRRLVGENPTLQDLCSVAFYPYLYSLRHSLVVNTNTLCTAQAHRNRPSLAFLSSPYFVSTFPLMKSWGVALNKNLGSKSHYSTLSSEVKTPDQLANFYWWFVGFSDGEASFILGVNKEDKGNINGFLFKFVLGLHKDDYAVLVKIQTILNMGRISQDENKCRLIINKYEDLKKLISIFDNYPLNTTKYLDFLIFKKAFTLNFERAGRVTPELIDQILHLKNEMNKSRTDFKMPSNHVININRYWLLGLIEGEGSFYVSRKYLALRFTIGLTAIQQPVLEKILEYLKSNLGFDEDSDLKLQSSSAIAITHHKSSNSNSKPSVHLTIQNLHILHNYFIPFLDELTFHAIKYKSFLVFKIICQAVYRGAHRTPEIQDLLLKLSLTMNEYSLTTSLKPLVVLSDDELETIKNAPSTIEYLKDGRVRDIRTRILIHQNQSCIYKIIKI